MRAQERSSAKQKRNQKATESGIKRNQKAIEVDTKHLIRKYNKIQRTNPKDPRLYSMNQTIKQLRRMKKNK